MVATPLFFSKNKLVLSRSVVIPVATQVVKQLREIETHKKTNKNDWKR